MIQEELLGKAMHEAFTVDSSIKILTSNLKVTREEEEERHEGGISHSLYRHPYC